MVDVATDIEIKQIEIEQLYPYIQVGFDGDEELLELYKLREPDGTLEDLVADNILNAIDFAKENDVKCFSLNIDGIGIGFTVLSKDFLYSFGINIYCRDKETVLDWFGWVKKGLGADFRVVLYKENTRAINFFLRNGMEVFNEDEKVIYLILK